MRILLVEKNNAELQNETPRGSWIGQCLERPFARFVLVGGLNFVVDYAALIGLARWTGWYEGGRNIVVKFMATSLAMVNSYLWNRFWTFKSNTREVAEVERIKRFLFITVTGNYVINAGVYYLTHNKILLPTGLPPTVSMFAASCGGVAAATLWNFFGYRKFVF